jgi:hypothetical protein
MSNWYDNSSDAPAPPPPPPPPSGGRDWYNNNTANAAPAPAAAAAPASPSPPPPGPSVSADPGDDDIHINLAWRTAHGFLSPTEDAREAAAQRMRRAVRPDEGRQEGAVSHGIEAAGRIIAAVGIDVGKRFVADPLIAGTRLMQQASQGRMPDPEIDPEGYRRLIEDVNTVASLAVAGGLSSRSVSGSVMKASASPAAESQASRSARTIEELRAPPKPEPPTGSGFLPAPKTPSEHIDELLRFAHDQAEEERYWEDRVANTHPMDAAAEQERIRQEMEELWKNSPHAAELEAKIAKFMKDQGDEGK